MSVKRITIKAGDTEPLKFTADAEGVSNLDNVTSVALYARKSGASTNHVDGSSATVSDSANKEVSFDPVDGVSSGTDAFAVGDNGTYQCYAVLTWSDGDTTRHPGSGHLILVVEETFEA